MTTTSMSDKQHESRERVSESERRAVLERDGQCLACGTAGENRLQLHHTVYRSQGGTHDRDNLITLCFRCHRLHHEGLLDYVVVDLGNDKIAVFFHRIYLKRGKR